MIRKIVFTLSICFCITVPARPVTDSLLHVLRSNAHDTLKINALNLLSDRFLLAGDYVLADKYADSASTLSGKVGFKGGMAKAFFYKCRAAVEAGNFGEAMKNASLAMAIYKDIDDKNGIASIYNTIGRIYADQANYPEALKNYLASLKIKMEDGNKKGIANGYNNIGNVFFDQGNYTEALQNYRTALAIREEIDDKAGMASSYHNLANIYNNQGKYPEALGYYEKALAINTSSGKKSWISNNLTGIGEVYQNMKNFRKAFENYTMALRIKKETGEKGGIAFCWVSVARSLTALNEFERPKAYLDSALRLSTEIGSKAVVKESYSALASLYYTQGKFKEAFDFYKKFSSIKDSLINSGNLANVSMLNVQFDLERKDNEIQLLNKAKETQAALSQAENRRQKLIIYSTAGIAFAIALIAFIIFRSLRIARKQQLIIQAQKNLVDEKNRHITDSIYYAKRIQESILMKEEEVAKILPFESFIFFQPKDIVSGDFYWLSYVRGDNSNKHVIAAADCTGHGVPGAFLSMIGNMLLNQTVNEKKITNPSEVLRELHRGIYNTLHHETESAYSYDGMDISLCTIDVEKQVISYAGANNPLYIIRNEKEKDGTGPSLEINVIKADSISLGDNLHRTNTVSDVIFSTHEIPLQKGMIIYLFSDGYMDQHGKGDKKRIGSERFRELLLESAHLSMKDQKQHLANAFRVHMGTDKQVDDVLVIGIRV